MPSVLERIANNLRRDILVMTSKAGSGHPTSSLSAVELMTVLFFGGVLRYDLARSKNPNNDRVIFSKGHATPLLYSLYKAAGAVSKKELLSYRTFGSPLEGHPSFAFPYTEAPTGSLGQGLSIGVGFSLASRMQKIKNHIFVLLGDSEMAEGQAWEAIQLASFYRLENLIGILDVNRLGQRGATMLGHNVSQYAKRISSFGWNTIVVDGHDIDAIQKAYQKALVNKGKPTMIIAKTVKGKGISFLENKNGWHGKVLDEQLLAKALHELQPESLVSGSIKLPQRKKIVAMKQKKVSAARYHPHEFVSTRKAYGSALARLAPKYPSLVVVDAEVSNSTFADIFAKKYPKKFFEMFIAEQNMIGVALGLALRGFIPAASSFAAFLSRGFDQLRMAGFARPHLIVAGSHVGVSVGQDGFSQMGLQDIAMFRTIESSIVLYPSDAVAAEKLLEQALAIKAISYIRTTRKETPVLYKMNESFPVGGSKILRKSSSDRATILAAGISVHEAIRAHDVLKKQNVRVRVIDVYSIKPLDEKTIKKAASETKKIIVVEDHVQEGGIAESVRSALGKLSGSVVSLAIKKTPKSGDPEKLLHYEGIDAEAIVRAVLNT